MHKYVCYIANTRAVDFSVQTHARSAIQLENYRDRVKFNRTLLPRYRLHLCVM